MPINIKNSARELFDETSEKLEATANSRTTSSQLKKSIIDEESLSAYNVCFSFLFSRYYSFFPYLLLFFLKNTHHF